MPAQKIKSVLIIEPNGKLILPYSHLSKSFIPRRESSLELALSVLDRVKPEIVFLSASFSAKKTLQFLESLKNFCNLSLIPLVIVVDWSHRLNFVPGTFWGNKIAVIDSLSCKKELESTLNRLL